MAADYRPRVERALRYIGEHLDRPLTVAEVARAAHLSEYHFHRIFAAIVGEPIGRHVTRRRLELAALRLAYEPERSIGEIALASGYSSSSNFTKAFTAHFGCSPTRVRSGEGAAATSGRLAAVQGKRFNPADLYALPPEASEAERRRFTRRSRARCASSSARGSTWRAWRAPRATTSRPRAHLGRARRARAPARALRRRGRRVRARV